VNNFVKLCPLPQLSGPMTCYYSIQFEGKATDETMDFFLRHETQPAFQEELDEILAWIDGIAHETGALEYLFRAERKAGALPPENYVRKRNRSKFQIQYQELNQLRLYLIRFNECVVVLLNGGFKTTRNPEECPNVRQYFRQAQHIADALDDALDNGDIRYNEDKTDIIIHHDFEIQLP
jgi:hypothetical protein